MYVYLCRSVLSMYMCKFTSSCIRQPVLSFRSMTVSRHCSSWCYWFWFWAPLQSLRRNTPLSPLLFVFTVGADNDSGNDTVEVVVVADIECKYVHGECWGFKTTFIHTNIGIRSWWAGHAQIKYCVTASLAWAKSERALLLKHPVKDKAALVSPAVFWCMNIIYTRIYIHIYLLTNRSMYAHLYIASTEVFLLPLATTYIPIHRNKSSLDAMVLRLPSPIFISCLPPLIRLTVKLSTQHFDFRILSQFTNRADAQEFPELTT